MKSSSKARNSNYFSNWLAHHIYCLVDGIRRMRNNAASSAITLTMIAVAFAVPLAAYTVVGKFSHHFEHWENKHEVTIFLSKSLTEAQVNALVKELTANPHLHDLNLITPDQALRDLSTRTEMSLWVDVLNENPLPNLITAIANTSQFSTHDLRTALHKLQDDKRIDRVVFDYVWLERLHAFIRVGQYVSLFLATLLSITVVLVVINTVRWEIETRKDELQIIRLVGGTDSYIRRPFLYMGILLGGLGAVFALILVGIALFFVSAPITHLFILYGSSSPRLTTDTLTAVLILVCGSGLGLIGAWTAVRQKLRQNRLAMN